MKTTPLNLLNSGHTNLHVMNQVRSDGEQTSIWITIKEGVATCGKHTFNVLPKGLETDFQDTQSFNTSEEVVAHLGQDWMARELYHAVGIIGDEDRNTEVTPIGDQVREHKQKPSSEITSSKDAAIHMVNVDWQQAIIDELGAGHHKSKNGYIAKSTAAIRCGKELDAFTFTNIKIQRCQSNQDVICFFDDNYMGLHLCRTLQV